MDWRGRLCLCVHVSAGYKQSLRDRDTAADRGEVERRQIVDAALYGAARMPPQLTIDVVDAAEHKNREEVDMGSVVQEELDHRTIAHLRGGLYRCFAPCRFRVDDVGLADDDLLDALEIAVRVSDQLVDDGLGSLVHPLRAVEEGNDGYG